MPHCLGTECPRLLGIEPFFNAVLSNAVIMPFG